MTGFNLGLICFVASVVELIYRGEMAASLPVYCLLNLLLELFNEFTFLPLDLLILPLDLLILPLDLLILPLDLLILQLRPSAPLRKSL